MKRVFEKVLHKCDSHCPFAEFDDGGGHMDSFDRCIKLHRIIHPWKYTIGEFPGDCPLPEYIPLRIFKHEGAGHWIGSCVVVSAVSMEMAEQFIRHKLDMAGLSEEELDIHEVKNANTQSSLIVMTDGDY